LDFALDGNWVDICSLITSAAYIATRKYSGTSKEPLASRKTAGDFANGISLFPLFLMTLCPASSVLLDGLVQASKISLSIAGFFALAAILEGGKPVKDIRQSSPACSPTPPQHPSSP
jgi:hypothetical protein